MSDSSMRWIPRCDYLLSDNDISFVSYKVSFQIYDVFKYISIPIGGYHYPQIHSDSSGPGECL